MKSKYELIDQILQYLISENKEGKLSTIPSDYNEKRKLIRAIMNIRMPFPADNNFYELQDELLSYELNEKGIVDVNNLPSVAEQFIESTIPYAKKLILWQGDITSLSVGAVVNAANSQLLGCFMPLHTCIDNAIHSSAGIQLREECYRIMEEQGHEEYTGMAKITNAYNLPCKYVIHTVGPIVQHKLTKELEKDLYSCYQSCLKCAIDHKVRSIAFCCISTGEFNFPNIRAAEIAIEAVIDFMEFNEDKIDNVIFNVFKDLDYEIYSRLLNNHN